MYSDRPLRGIIMLTLVVIVCAPNWKRFVGRRARTQRLDLLAGAEEERLAGTDRARTSASCRPRCGRSTCRTSSSGSISVFILGTPNGQASTQLLQAMQRGLRAVCTTPSAVLLDRVGRAHFGAGGRVAVHADDRHRLHATTRDRRSRDGSSNARDAYRTRVQACTHAWQPMQRLWIDEELVLIGNRHELLR